MTNKLKLMIHPKGYKSKPNSDDIRFYINGIANHPREIDVENLAKELTNGKTMTCGYFKTNEWGQIKRQENFWYSQQVVALDFDNETIIKNAEGKNIKVKKVSVTLKQALENEFIKKYAAFAYKTFSCTEDHPKFRVVFIFDKPFYDLNKCKSVIEELLYKFPMADKKCSDGARLFFGGTDLHVINYDNRLPTQTTLWEDIKGLYLIYPPKGSSNSYTLNNSDVIKPKQLNKPNIHKGNKFASNIQYISQLDIHSLHNIIKPRPIILHNNQQVYNFLKKQDLKIYLGVNSDHLYDIFHDEDSPSASIYQSNLNNGHWMYKCHSTSSSFVGTIIQITEKLLGCSMVDAKDFLMKVYDIELQESEIQKRLKEEIDAYKYMLQSEELPELYPNFYKLFTRYGYLDNLYILLDLVKENLPADSDNPRLLFYHSINTIAKRFMKSTTNTGIRMNFFTFFRLICKLDDSEIPDHILQIHNQYKKSKNYKYRNNTYEMKLYSYNFFATLDRQCEDWIAKGLTTKSMNYEGVLRNYGQEEANRVFPQDKDKKVSELNDDIVSIFELTTLSFLEDKGWATEKVILDEIKLYFKGQKALKENLMKRCIGDMLDKYDLERVSCNKTVKQEMQITEADLPAASFPKIIRKKHY